MRLGITPHASFNGLNPAVCFTLVLRSVSLGKDLGVRVVRGWGSCVRQFVLAMGF